MDVDSVVALKKYAARNQLYQSMGNSIGNKYLLVQWFQLYIDDENITNLQQKNQIAKHVGNK